MIAADMIEERLCRNRKKDVLEFFQVFDAGNLFQRIGITEDEVAETEIVRYDTSQVYVHLLGVFIDERRIIFSCVRNVIRFGRLYNQRDKRIFLSYGGA